MVLAASGGPLSGLVVGFSAQRLNVIRAIPVQDPAPILLVPPSRWRTCLFGGVIVGMWPGEHRGTASPSFVFALDQMDEDRRTEVYQIVYEDPIYPKNLDQNRKPYKHDEYRAEVIDRQVALMHDRDIWKKPASQEE